jgi:transcriptional regulator of acetoin/glycerol metabolism
MLSGVQPDDYRPLFEPGCPKRHSRLLRAASPVLARLVERLSGSGLSVILADSRARILERRVEEPDLLRQLDEAMVTPGFVFAEDITGTNGLGTALESRQVVKVVGSEHYVDRLQQLTCVAAPIFDPLSGQLEGIIDFTCAVEKTSPLIVPMAEQAARDIEEQLLLQQGATERALLEAFLAASRRSRGGILLMNERFQMSNAIAARLLRGMDHAVLWEQAGQALAADHAMHQELALSDGSTITAHIEPLRDGGVVIGVQLEIRRPRDDEGRVLRTPQNGIRTRPPLGLAGHSRRWVAACSVARDAVAGCVPLLLMGEPGVGKLAVALALCREVGAEPLVLDAAMGALEGLSGWTAALRNHLTGRPGTVIIRHLELLTAPAARTVLGIVAPATDRGWRFVGTLTLRGEEDRSGTLPGLAAARVELPPLRERIEDLPAIASSLLARQSSPPGRRLSAEAAQALMRLDWPGNLRELGTVLDRLAAATTRAEIRLADLPHDIMRGAARRRLTRFERAELHAILAALEETDGNKVEAARLLGISRSTVYRKLRALGVDLQRAAF